MRKGVDSPDGSGPRETSAVRPNPDVISRRVDAGTILIHLRTNRIYELNATGTRIWELLGSGCTAASIRTCLQQEFEVEEAEADRAIDETLGLLMRENLLDAGSMH